VWRCYRVGDEYQDWGGCPPRSKPVTRAPSTGSARPRGNAVHILNGGALPTLNRCRDQYPLAAEHLGALMRPRHISRLAEILAAGYPVGIDNDAFSNWNLQSFVVVIGKIELAVFGHIATHAQRTGPLAPLGLDPAASGLPAPPSLAPCHRGLLFVTVPDVPFDARATARRWSEWAPLMSHLPLALCVQDGAGDVGIPWGWPGLRALFMAGSTSYKLSTEMAEICREGKRRGLHIHAGRVNSRKRINHLLSLDGVVDSIDGLSFERWRDTKLGWGLRAVAADTYQLALDTPPRPPEEP
jgi:hypothetical protein